MKYCKICVYPENAKPTILFDNEGICSGCKNFFRQKKFDWNKRYKNLEELIDKYKFISKKNKQDYDCIIPVSGGKDSHYQAHIAIKKFKLKPLFVTYNHCFNTQLGLRNLNNLVKVFDADLIRFTSSIEKVRKISKFMLKKTGDLTWHYHTGIFSYPFQVAKEKKIPLMIWGEPGYAINTGVYTLDDYPEYTKWVRDEYQMRGFKLSDLINNKKSLIKDHDLHPFKFPRTEDLEKIGVRGIYLGSYLEWDHLKIVKQMVSEYNFKLFEGIRERTFSSFHKIDDHANDIHDYLKYLKFGYGRGTDHASAEVRYGRMTRNEAVKIVNKYDNVKPKSLSFYLKFLRITEKEFYKYVESMRDKKIWKKIGDNKYVKKFNVKKNNYQSNIKLDKKNYTFSKKNRRFFNLNKKQKFKYDDNLINDIKGQFRIL